MQIAVTLSPTVQISADSFDAGLASKSVLSLEVGRERFRFMVQDSRGQGLYLEDYTFPSLLTERSVTGVLPEVFREHPVLSAGPWQEIRIGVNSPSFTLIPAPLFRKEYAGSYLSLMRGSALPAHEFAQSYTHEAEGFLSVFNMEHPLADFFSETYPLQPLVFIHQVGTLIQATADLDRHALTADNVYLFFEDEFVTIICRSAGKVRFCNRFGYKNVQDLAYYMLYVFEEQALTPELIPVFLYGEITPFAEAYAELSRFLPNLTFGQIPPGLRLSSAFDDLPNHRYLSLYGLGLLSE
ncbi:DUF3822 family protein [Spirosoma linguale]|uniref:DUF3822 domain-containing protein n=1 Tax=Spirosoma linguale (strain ATCC 33905 / DSM 74 / LMG 10896 / Claus 1) TaxID=504472 RepID=D2QN30_SPILD|nr:hypothetical protein Slin_1464 [Spirosoma linguale DSM 74]